MGRIWLLERYRHLDSQVSVVRSRWLFHVRGQDRVEGSLRPAGAGSRSSGYDLRDTSVWFGFIVDFGSIWLVFFVSVEATCISARKAPHYCTCQVHRFALICCQAELLALAPPYPLGTRKPGLRCSD